MNPLVTYRNLANATFISNLLDEKGVIYKIEKSTSDAYSIYVKDQDIELAKRIIQSQILDDEPVSEDSLGTIDELEAWNKNMYNPGYYSGGKIPPYRKFLASQKHVKLQWITTFAFVLVYGYIMLSLDLSTEGIIMVLIAPVALIVAFIIIIRMIR